ncbi:hypothetical protein PR048_018335 [Dryococelus australis]|uniref:Uncharacterized protein n=1 Tax=Dryococelus australis TaxID=614101 RepID=A0ABQ9HC57_9NEOP|nr:hypothetical protein PR048_018335 [Dryococelus australis]
MANYVLVYHELEVPRNSTFCYQIITGRQPLSTENVLANNIERHDGNTARHARRSEEALGVRVSVARIAPSLLDLGRGVIPHARGYLETMQAVPSVRSFTLRTPVAGSATLISATGEEDRLKTAPHMFGRHRARVLFDKHCRATLCRYTWLEASLRGGGGDSGGRGVGGVVLGLLGGGGGGLSGGQQRLVVVLGGGPQPPPPATAQPGEQRDKPQAHRHAHADGRRRPSLARPRSLLHRHQLVAATLVLHLRPQPLLVLRPGALLRHLSCTQHHHATYFSTSPTGCSRREISAALNNKVLRADTSEMMWEWCSAGMQWQGKQEIPE